MHGLGLATASLLIQWVLPVPPGTWKFLALFLLPALVALGWKGFWSGVWTAAAVWVGSLLLWGSSLAWAPAAGVLVFVIAVAGLGAGYIPLPGRVRLGWQEAAVNAPDATALWHNGGTGGYRSFIGFVVETQVGVAVLSNSANSVDDIGMNLLKRLHEAGSASHKREEATSIRRAL